MITLTKIDGNEFILNAEEIETVEFSFDTTITLKSGKKIIVKEKPEEIKNKVIDYKRICYSKLINVDH